MRALALVLIVVALPLLVARANPQDKTPPRKDADASAMKVKELQKERIATLEKLVDSCNDLFRAGRGDYAEVLESQSALFHAKREVAETGPERIAIYKTFIELLKNAEKVAQGRVNQGRGNMATLLKITAKRLEITIALEKEKAKQANENK